MKDDVLPQIFTLEEIAEYLKVNQDVLLDELEKGDLKGFQIGHEWRCSDEDLLAYIKAKRNGVGSSITSTSLPQQSTQDREWRISDNTGPFDFNWPKTGGGSQPEHYDKRFEASTTINGQEYTFTLAFGNRKSAGKTRRRVTIWLGNRAIVEFAGSNNYENDRLLAGIIRLKNGKQLVPGQRVPEEHRGFRVERYNSIVQGSRASTGMAVIVHEDALNSMLEHAVIRATWKELIK
ncbi:MAG: helix-turn-helix domain-containing protein [Dehalococcoidia bacterium]